MRRTPEALFDRWRRNRDPRWLGKVFDRTAEPLFRLAVHLTGRTGDAEDLVQATFLEAIEHAARFDASRPLLPWLSGILANRARLLARRERRAADVTVAGVVEPAAPADDPADALERRESFAEALAAIDRLPEPYRQPVLLRVHHGLEVSDVAHLLGRSPGTVRVQVHRGLQMLRRTLPAAVLAAMASLPLSGLDGVRRAVLAHAASLSAGTAVAGLASFGGIVVMKKLAALAVAVIALTMGTIVLTRDGRGDAETRPLAGTEAPEPASPVHEDPLSAVPAEPLAAEPLIRPRREDDGARWLAGRIVDAETGAPLSSACISLHLPQTTPLRDFALRFGDFLRRDWDGRLRPHVEGIAIVSPVDEVTWVHGGTVQAVWWPEPDDAGWGDTVSDAAGAFRIRRPAGPFLLVAATPCHGERRVVVGAEEEDLEIALHREREISGYVVDRKGRRIERSFDLTFRASSAGGTSVVMPAWPVSTDPRGGFTARIAAPRVRVESRTPGYVASQSGTLFVNGRLWHEAVDIDVDAAKAPFAIVLDTDERLRLRVTDAETGSPIPEVFVLTRNEHGFPQRCGRSYDAGGIHVIESHGWLATSTLDGTLWAEGYAAKSITIPAAESRGEHAVALERGAIDSLRGTLRRGGAPVGGATVALRAYHFLNWSSSDRSVVAATRTDSEGGFVLDAPPGRYLLRAGDGNDELLEPVIVPTPAPFDLDFADLASVVVTVLGSDGAPQVKHNVSVTARDGQQQAGMTGDDGTVRFRGLRPGPGKAFISRRPTEGSWVGELVEDLALEPGAEAAVTFRLPGDEAQIILTLVLDGEPPPAGWDEWRVKDLYGSRAWIPILEGGVVAEPLTGTPELVVKEGARRQWRFKLPPGSRGAMTHRLPCRGLAYEGLLADAASRPLAHHRIFAQPDGREDLASLSTVTGPDGRFLLSGLAEAAYTLAFNPSADAPYSQVPNNPLGAMHFTPRAAPASPPTLLTIHLPRELVKGAPDVVTVSGRILDASGQPRPGISVGAEVRLERPAGTFVGHGGWVYPDPGGGYELEVPRGETLRVRAWSDRHCVAERSLPLAPLDTAVTCDLTLR